MATIKSYTDLEQSKALSKILPLESADMSYYKDAVTKEDNPRVMNFLQVPKSKSMYYSPCWSLAALLKVIGNIFKYNLDYNGISFILTVGDFKVSDITAVDASFKMILKLKEESLL